MLLQMVEQAIMHLLEPHTSFGVARHAHGHVCHKHTSCGCVWPRPQVGCRPKDTALKALSNGTNPMPMPQTIWP